MCGTVLRRSFPVLVALSASLPPNSSQSKRGHDRKGKPYIISGALPAILLHSAVLPRSTFPPALTRFDQMVFHSCPIYVPFGIVLCTILPSFFQFHPMPKDSQPKAKSQKAKAKAFQPQAQHTCPTKTQLYDLPEHHIIQASQHPSSLCEMEVFEH